jgi:predicted nucleic acid-binding protein
MIDILDASVVVKWFCPEDQSSTEKAARVLDELKIEPKKFACPELLFSECLHVFSRKFGGETEHVIWAMDRIFRLGIRPLRWDATMAGLAAKDVGRGLSGYDATYYAIARAVGGRWLTFDSRAAAAVSDARYVKVL